MYQHKAPEEPTMLFTTESFVQADAQYRAQRIKSSSVRNAARRVRRASQPVQPAIRSTALIPQQRPTDRTAVGAGSR